MPNCSICRNPYTGYGNNAQPINDGRCCDRCNTTKVIQARIAKIRKQKEVICRVRKEVYCDGLRVAFADKDGKIIAKTICKHDLLAIKRCKDIIETRNILQEVRREVMMNDNIMLKKGKCSPDQIIKNLFSYIK